MGKEACELQGDVVEGVRQPGGRGSGPKGEINESPVMAGMADGKQAQGEEESSPFYSHRLRRGDPQSLMLRGSTGRPGSGCAGRTAP